MINVNYQNISLYHQYLGYQLYFLSSNLKESIENILEIGPGNGQAAREFMHLNNKWNGSLTFVEPSADAGKLLKKKFPGSEVLDVTFEKSLRQLQRMRPFDLVVANFSLHWIENIEKKLLDINAIMPLGGILAFSNTDYERSFWAQIDKKISEELEGCSLFKVKDSHALSIEKWKRMTEESGFELCEAFEYDGVAAVYKSIDMAMNLLKKSAGDKYLKLASGISQDEVEGFIRKELKKNLNEEKKIPLNASGYSLIFKKSREVKV